jgi:hypothetical protein
MASQGLELPMRPPSQNKVDFHSQSSQYGNLDAIDHRNDVGVARRDTRVVGRSLHAFKQQLDGGCKSAVDRALSAGPQELELHPLRARRVLRILHVALGIRVVRVHVAVSVSDGGAVVEIGSGGFAPIEAYAWYQGPVGVQHSGSVFPAMAIPAKNAAPTGGVRALC